MSALAAADGPHALLGVCPGCELVLIVEGTTDWHRSEAIGYAVRHRDAQVLTGTLDGSRSSADTLAFEKTCGVEAICLYSAGNDPDDDACDFTGSVVSVGAVRDDGQPWQYSPPGDVRAPSGDVDPVECVPQNGFKALCTAEVQGSPGPFGGTSGSAPIAAGVAPLVLAACDSLSPSQVEDILKQASDGGFVDALKAVRVANTRCPP